MHTVSKVRIKYMLVELITERNFTSTIFYMIFLKISSDRGLH